MSRLVVALRGLSLPRCHKCATKRSCLFVPQLSYSEEIAVEEVTFCDAQGRALWVVASLKPGECLSLGRKPQPGWLMAPLALHQQSS
jgi:hypothetical protein